MGENRFLVIRDVHGAGTEKDPRVTIHMPKDYFLEPSAERRDGCIRQSWAVAKALEWPHVVIRSWNHKTQYDYDKCGNKTFSVDEKGVRRPKNVPADSHITVQFRDPKIERFCHGHIYTIDDDNDVPQRLMLIGEREHTRFFDYQSPQLWWSDPKRLEQQELADKDDMLTIIQKQWVRQVILFDIDMRIDLTAVAIAYVKKLRDLEDEETLDCYVPEVS